MVILFFSGRSSKERCHSSFGYAIKSAFVNKLTRIQKRKNDSYDYQIISLTYITITTVNKATNNNGVKARIYENK